MFHVTGAARRAGRARSRRARELLRRLSGGGGLPLKTPIAPKVAEKGRGKALRGPQGRTRGPLGRFLERRRSPNERVRLTR